MSSAFALRGALLGDVLVEHLDGLVDQADPPVAARIVGDLLVGEARADRGEQVEVVGIGDATRLRAGHRRRARLDRRSRTTRPTARSPGSCAGTAAGSERSPRCRSRRSSATTVFSSSSGSAGRHERRLGVHELLARPGRTSRRRSRASNRSSEYSDGACMPTRLGQVTQREGGQTARPAPASQAASRISARVASWRSARRSRLGVSNIVRSVYLASGSVKGGHGR